MIIANKLRSSNRAEYLLYMWQVEDILRAYQCNIDRIKSEYLNRFTLTPDYRVLPYVIEIRAKGEKKEKNEIETCFDILYCTMLLRLQHKEISAETQKAVTDISTLLGQLSDYFLKNQKEAIDF